MMMVLLVIVLIREGCKDTGLIFLPVVIVLFVIALICEGCRDKSFGFFEWSESEFVLNKHDGFVR